MKGGRPNARHARGRTPRLRQTIVASIGVFGVIRQYRGTARPTTQPDRSPIPHDPGRPFPDLMPRGRPFPHERANQYHDAMERRSPHTLGNRIRRLLWGIVWGTLFRTSPRNLHRWRNMLLRLFGGQLHRTARVYPRARVWGPWNLVMEEGATIADDVDVYCVDTIRIGAWTTVSQYTYLCGATHDYEDPDFPLQPRPISIGKNAWVAADVFVAPGITIGEGTVVGVRSAVLHDLEPWIVAAGTPAKKIKDRVLRGIHDNQAPSAE